MQRSGNGCLGRERRWLHHQTNWADRWFIETLRRPDQVWYVAIWFERLHPTTDSDLIALIS